MADIYVDGELATGNNDGTSWADAFRTEAAIQGGFDGLVAGETAHCTRTLTLTSPLDIDQHSGADGNPIRVIGYNYNGGSPVIDGTRFVLDADHAAAHAISADGVDHWVWENVEFKKATADNAYAASSCRYWIFHRCLSRDTQAAGGGNGWGGAGANWRGASWLLCEARDNDGMGFDRAYDGAAFIGCLARGNASYGFRLNAACTAALCIAHANGHANFYNYAGNVTYLFCVADGAGAFGGVRITAGPTLALGCRLTDNTSYGLDISTATVLDLWNCYLNNTTGTVNGGGSLAIHEDKGTETRITSGAEGYEDEADDEFNLRLGAAGWRTEVDFPDGVNFLRFARGLPTNVIPHLAKMGGKQ